jgi:hypothetical protein
MTSAAIFEGFEIVVLRFAVALKKLSIRHFPGDFKMKMLN